MAQNVGPFQIEPIAEGMRLSFEVAVQTGDAQLKKATFGQFEIICDESAAIGGADSAPPPLAFFAASIAF